MKYFIKVITGFREDQQYTIPMQEAHKAYYLFTHPDSRGVFDNGVALVGRNINEIRPDWNMTLGYNPDYKMTEDDWNNIRGKRIDTNMRTLLEKAKATSSLMEENKAIGKLQLKEAIKMLPSEDKINILEENTALNLTKHNPQV